MRASDPTDGAASDRVKHALLDAGFPRVTQTWSLNGLVVSVHGAGEDRRDEFERLVHRHDPAAHRIG